ncbi:MAG TPA: cupin domain-containing protein [Actinomycetota bacterium]|nr:cupin domain-containing protein [Actinomycetota bacterium]
MTVADASRLVVRAPGAIRANDVVLKLWGDDVSGQVNDEIFVSNEKIQQMRFTMPPGARFTHSPAYRTAMGADEVYHVLRGRLVLANPETGEVHVARAGDAVAFGRDTWHHGFSDGDDALDVMQYFAPPPATGSSQAYARTRPFLERATYVQDEWLRRWPDAAGDARTAASMQVLREADALWRVEGDAHPIVVAVLRSTDELTSGTVELRPGQRSDERTHGGDLAGFVTAGRLHLFLPRLEVPGAGNGWFRMDAGDGFYVPAGEPYRLHNMGDVRVRFLFGVAPAYLDAHAPAGAEAPTPA